MDSREQTLFEPATAVYPGEVVSEYLEYHGWAQRELARRSGLTPKTISEICSGNAPITPPTALALEKVFQRPAHLWLTLQSHFDEFEARQRQQVSQNKWTEWVLEFPLKDMKRLKFSVPSRQSDVESLLNFFGVSSPDSWQSVWDASAVAYRQTRQFRTSQGAMAAWVRETEIVAMELQLREFDEQLLRSSIGEMRQLTCKRTDEIMDPLQSICARAGVAVVLVPALPQTGISGCSRWLGNRGGLIGLTMRYKTDDQLWFTFFHELGHLLLHRRKRSFVLDNAAETLDDRVVDPEMEAFESEANAFARDALIPAKELSEFIRKGVFTNDSIHDFAQDIGVGPGIVVGRLQHDLILGRHQGNAFKQKLNWTF
ncbi:MAG TPA: HigA family addiction module antitoxin [Tepidisphaeraceae bacterium]|jgi:addiction module HigA family antidote|nr:HigA family addiction module antitoxin [Tepidisphaeraceae bacterium]